MLSQSNHPTPAENPAQSVSSTPATPAGSLFTILSAPSPAALRELQGDLLQANLPLSTETWQLLADFHDFLVSIATRATSRQYSHFASLLDMGAVGIVALQHVLSARGEPQFWSTFLLSALSEGLMITAARQYVKAWEGEMAAVQEQTVWKVQQAFWRVSLALQPQMDAAERRQHLNRLIAALEEDSHNNSTIRTLLLVRYFQVLLLTHLHLDLNNQWAVANRQ